MVVTSPGAAGCGRSREIPRADVREPARREAAPAGAACPVPPPTVLGRLDPRRAPSKTMKGSAGILRGTSRGARTEAPASSTEAGRVARRRMAVERRRDASATALRPSEDHARGPSIGSDTLVTGHSQATGHRTWPQYGRPSHRRKRVRDPRRGGIAAATANPGASHERRPRWHLGKRPNRRFAAHCGGGAPPGGRRANTARAGDSPSAPSKR
jgi:hypothetical protein